MASATAPTPSRMVLFPLLCQLLQHNYKNGEDYGALEFYNDWTLRHQLNLCSMDESSHNLDEDMGKSKAGLY